MGTDPPYLSAFLAGPDDDDETVLFHGSDGRALDADDAVLLDDSAPETPSLATRRVDVAVARTPPPVEVRTPHWVWPAMGISSLLWLTVGLAVGVLLASMAQG